jgi:hypothetical protein
VWVLRRGFGFPAVAVALLGILPGVAVAAQNAPSVSDSSSRQNVLRQYCVTCHNERSRTGGLSLEALDIAHVTSNAETWERVLRKLQLGVMPPQGVRRPDEATYDDLIDWLEDSLDRSAATNRIRGIRFFIA